MKKPVKPVYTELCPELLIQMRDKLARSDRQRKAIDTNRLTQFMCHAIPDTDHQYKILYKFHDLLDEHKVGSSGSLSFLPAGKEDLYRNYVTPTTYMDRLGIDEPHFDEVSPLRQDWRFDFLTLLAVAWKDLK